MSKVNLQHPLMRGVQGVFRPGPEGRMREVAFNEPITGEIGDPLLSIRGAAQDMGYGRDFGVDTDLDADEFSGKCVVKDINQAFVWFGYIKPAAETDTNQEIFGMANDGAGDEIFSFRVNGASTGHVILRYRDATGAADLTETGEPDRRGQLIMLGSSSYAATNGEFYVNGVLADTHPTMREEDVGNHNVLSFARAGDNSPGGWSANIVYLAITWDRRLSAAEHKQLYDNPWQIFKSKPILVPLTAAAPTVEDLAPAIVVGDVTFTTDLDQLQTVQLDAAASAAFIVQMAMAQGTGSVDTTMDFNIDLDQQQTNVADRPVSFSATIDLTQLQQVQKDAVETALFNISLSQQQSNVKITGEQLTFTTDLDMQLLNQLIANVSINIDIDLLFQISTGAVDASITFLANMSMAQTNTITADKAVTMLMNLAEQHSVQMETTQAIALVLQVAQAQSATRGVPGDATFTTLLDQSQINVATRVGLMALDTVLDQTLSTAGSVWGQTVSFASILNYQIATEGLVDGAITYSMILNQGQIGEKITDVAMGFNVDADIISTIHLAAEGTIDFTALMSQTEFKQLTGQSEITFGQIAGLAALNSADFGADISMGIIQDFSINGFVAQFTITTPANRTVTVYIEDRTTLVEDGDRTVLVSRNL